MTDPMVVEEKRCRVSGRQEALRTKGIRICFVLLMFSIECPSNVWESRHSGHFCFYSEDRAVMKQEARWKRKRGQDQERSTIRDSSSEFPVRNNPLYVDALTTRLSCQQGFKNFYYFHKYNCCYPPYWGNIFIEKLQKEPKTVSQIYLQRKWWHPTYFCSLLLLFHHFLFILIWKYPISWFSFL